LEKALYSKGRVAALKPDIIVGNKKDPAISPAYSFPNFLPIFLPICPPAVDVAKP